MVGTYHAAISNARFPMHLPMHLPTCSNSTRVYNLIRQMTLIKMLNHLMRLLFRFHYHLVSRYWACLIRPKQTVSMLVVLGRYL